MNDNIDFDEWEQNNDGLDWEDQRQDFYEQLQGWVQKNVEVKRLRAEVDSEIRLLRTYLQMVIGIYHSECKIAFHIGNAMSNNPVHIVTFRHINHHHRTISILNCAEYDITRLWLISRNSSFRITFRF